MSVRRPSQQTLAVLAALVDQPGNWRYGYDLSKEVGLASGTLYPILIRLKERGLLQTCWSDPEQTGRPRHLYRLTANGQAWAVDSLETAAEEGRAQSRWLPAEG